MSAGWADAVASAPNVVSERIATKATVLLRRPALMTLPALRGEVLPPTGPTVFSTWRSDSRRRSWKRSRFMMRTKEAPGWASQCRELVMDLDAMLHDLRGNEPAVALALDPDSYVESQALAKALRTAGSNGLIYPSVRDAGGQCVGLFYPDLTTKPVQGRHLDYHWDGTRVDLYREAGTGEVFRVDWIG
jgi:hypothetical protein